MIVHVSIESHAKALGSLALDIDDFTVIFFSEAFLKIRCRKLLIDTVMLVLHYDGKT